MSPVWFIVLLVLIFGVVAMLTSPWRRSQVSEAEQADGRLREADADLEDLEAARDQKYREIRDAELDRQTGKLSDADFATIDSGLRAEAVDILRRLDRAQRRVDKLRGTDIARQLPQDIGVADHGDADPGSEPGRDGQPAGSPRDRSA